MTELRRYVAGIVLLCAAAAILTSQPSEPDDEYQGDPFRAAVSAAGERFALHSEIFRREHSRSIATAAVSRAPRSASPIMVLSPSAPPTFAVRAERFASPELSGGARAEGSPRVVVAFVADTGEHIDGTPVTRVSSDWSVDLFPPGTIADDVCAIVLRVHDAKLYVAPRRSESNHYFRWLSTPCRSYFDYGLPGRGIAAWLDSTSFGALKQWRNIHDTDITESAPGPSCASGDDNACLRILLQRDRNRSAVHTAGWLGRWRARAPASNYAAASIMRTIEHEVGPQGFAELWRSNADLPQAFEAVRGEPLASWIRRRVTVREGSYHAGPLPSRPVVAGLAFVVPLLLVIGARSVSRRATVS